MCVYIIDVAEQLDGVAPKCLRTVDVFRNRPHGKHRFTVKCDFCMDDASDVRKPSSFSKPEGVAQKTEPSLRILVRQTRHQQSRRVS